MKSFVLLILGELGFILRSLSIITKQVLHI